MRAPQPHLQIFKKKTLQRLKSKAIPGALYLGEDNGHVTLQNIEQ